MTTRSVRRLGAYVTLAVLVTANVFIWVQRDTVLDWWRLRGYTPPTQIVELADTTTMTDYGRRLFYANHPGLEDRQSFNELCADYSEATAVLGCYHGRRQGIYIYAVDDPRLQGVLQVTAAHEMLHEAYDRLSGAELDKVRVLLGQYRDSEAMDQELKDKLENYRVQGADLYNEMHSIFGTEVGVLPRELESYYSRYFTDRVRVVAYNEAYKGEFTRRKQLVEQYDAQLAGLRNQIEADKAWLAGTLDELEAIERQINQRAVAKDRDGYEESIREYNVLVDAYNDRLVATRGRIDEYNSIVVQRNEIATEEQKLQESLDSRYAPTRQQ